MRNPSSIFLVAVAVAAAALGSVSGCGGGGSPAPKLTTSVPGDKPLNGLSSGEVTTLCGDLTRFHEQSTIDADTCRLTGFLSAAILAGLSPASTDADLEMACADGTASCASGENQAAQMCNAPGADCMATVAEAVTCSNDSAAGLHVLAGQVPDCASTNRAAVGAHASVTVALLGGGPASCQTVLMKCPSFAGSGAGGAGGSGGAGGAGGVGGTAGNNNASCPPWTQIVAEDFGRTGDTLWWTLQVAVVPPQLVFNQTSVADNGLEYQWGVNIDSDRDGTSDLQLAVSHFKVPGAAAMVSGDLLNVAQEDLWQSDGAGGFTSIASPTVTLTGNTFRFEIPVSANPALGLVTDRAQSTFRTYYDSGTLPNGPCMQSVP